MKTYKGLNRFELIEKIIDAKIEQCKKENFAKHGNTLPRQNENRKNWEKLYKTYPITSSTCFCLASEYDSLCLA